MRRCWSCLVGLTLAAAQVHAQGLRDKISELFIFTAGQDPLFLGSIVGSSCTPYGVPTHENDVIALRLALDLDMTVTSFFVSFGLLDKVDIGVVLPIVSASLRGTSDARIVPFGGTTAQHFFGGTST